MAQQLKFSLDTQQLLHASVEESKKWRHEFIMPEHLLSALLEDSAFEYPLKATGCIEEFAARLDGFLGDLEKVPDNVELVPSLSVKFKEMLDKACSMAVNAGKEEIWPVHLVQSLLTLEESWGAYLLKECLGDKEPEFLSHYIDCYELDLMAEEDFKSAKNDFSSSTDWKQLALCMNECYQDRNPLIGRKDELERTIQVLCRADKNNPLHVGEPGVGKTALVWGLVRLIEEGNVPERLKGSKIYQVDIGSLLAGTQYRGDFEKRIKQLMEGISAEEGNNIVYIDEIHTLVGAGATSDSAMDASNMLKPYLESGKIRFIGSTTYGEYNRHFSKSKGMIRRFQQIDISEPTPEATKEIITQLLPRYEEFHGVKYSKDAVDMAVDGASRFINDRYLPDKAIDLIDEAGAAMEMRAEKQTIDGEHIAAVLAKICKVDSLAVAKADDYTALESLAPRMLASIYGQDSAVKQVVEAVQMARAGLLEENKPLASLLFVGPTGVGKTEVARVLAKELGVELIRFDMSEYAEKHSVAKLIGSPAGYVGYEDGGLLTDAIRKTPNSVLLLDEIEKAHEDIYNILLQVMDYARLTDNKGRQADFRNVVIIMTSNAGARYASQGTVGFESSVTRGASMMREVKKTFKPEFLNRLSGAVVFNDMDRSMAELILKKKLRQLEERLKAKNVTMELAPEVFDYLLKEGFTPEYGAREMDRVIASRLKPPLMREILFGNLRGGGTASIKMKDGGISVG